MPIGAKECILGRLRYCFEYTAEGLELKMVTLVGYQRRYRALQAAVEEHRRRRQRLELAVAKE